MKGRVLMVQGTGSSVGKTLIVAALCRIWSRRGLRVAPFKAQNMANNAAVCPDGAEIGRAQALQAMAAGIEPTADMNPILLKPETGGRVHVVVRGRPWKTVAAGEYSRYRDDLWPIVAASLDHLRAGFDRVVIEGAGSPAELNLRAGDLANMAVARYAGAPVLLVGDIDRGGVFAALLGTLWLLPPDERRWVRGLVVNKFRGDVTLFREGIRILEERSGLPVLGVVPYIEGLCLPEEDAAVLYDVLPRRLPSPGSLDIAVPLWPGIANTDDLLPLRTEPGVSVRCVTTPQELGRPQAIVLPGSKNTVADLMWLRRQGLAEAIVRLAAEGVAVVGLCGGYQMLGRSIRDPEGVESPQGECPGLGLLPVETVFRPEKATYRTTARIRASSGWLSSLAGRTVAGYEIHMGTTVSPCPWLELIERNGTPTSLPDGALAADGRIWGCYLHGILSDAGFRHTWLRSLGWNRPASAPPPPDPIQTALDRLADEVEAHLDMRRLEAILQEA